MKYLLCIIALLSFASQAKEKPSISVQLEDTLTVTRIGDSEYRRPSCFFVIVEQDGSRRSSAVYPGETCTKNKDATLKALKEDAIIVSLTLNGKKEI